METKKSNPELAGEAARTINLTLDATGPSPSPSPEVDAPTRPATPAAAPTRPRSEAFTAVFDKALAKLGEAHGAMKERIASDQLAVHDARPNLKDARFPRDRWLVGGGRAVDGIVYLIIPMGKVEWRAAFGRECVNYATISRSTDKKHAIMPTYGDTVIAFLHTTVGDRPVTLVEIDPALLDDAEAWVATRVEEMMAAVVRRLPR